MGRASGLKKACRTSENYRAIAPEKEPAVQKQVRRDGIGQSDDRTGHVRSLRCGRAKPTESNLVPKGKGGKA